MRRALAISLLFFAPTASGCKKVDELQAALDDANAQLTGTRAELKEEQEKNEQLNQKNDELEAEIVRLQEEIKGLESQINDLATKAGVTQKELEELRKEKAKREAELKVYKDLFASLKSLVDAGKIKVTFRKGRMVVNLDNSILFDSGKTTLKEEGSLALTELAQALATVADRDWLVAGHTDNIPIRTKRFRSNWDLSTARAVEVVNYLIEQGMVAQHLGAAGFGEFDPTGDNATEEGRAENRRIEIILMPALGSIPGMQKMLTDQ